MSLPERLTNWALSANHTERNSVPSIDQLTFGLTSSEWWMVLFTGILVFVSIWAAYAAYRQAKIAQNQSLTSLLLSFLDTYSSKEFLASLAELRNYKQEHKEQLNHLSDLYKCIYQKSSISEQTRIEAERYVSLCENTVGCEGISEHRARLAWFYSKIWRLHRYGFLTKDVMKTLCSLDGTGAFLDVAVPLTLAIRYVKIHNGDEVSFRKDPNVGWYRDIEKIYEQERPDLNHRY